MKNHPLELNTESEADLFFSDNTKDAGEKSSRSAPIFDIQHLCPHDGPGMRTVVFFKGCPLQCTWCSNPEGQDPMPQLRWRSKKCSSCFSCMEKCDRKAIVIRDNGNVKFPYFNRFLCSDCDSKDCIKNCPNDAIDTVGRDMTPDELFNILKKEIRLYWNTGGGVTFSGGEPLLYPEFIGEVAKKLKQFNINIAVETCGFFNWRMAEKALELCDIIFFDIKTTDEEIHRRFTGKSNGKILANLEKLAHKEQFSSISPKKIVVSMPIIPGVTDTVEKVRSAGEYIAGLGIKRAKLLPYHRLSLGKYNSLGLNYPHEQNDRDIEKELIKKMKEELEGMGIEVQE